MALLVFLAGGTLLALLVRAWRPEISRRTAAVYLLVTTVFFAAPLTGWRLQLPTDIAYQWRPWAAVALLSPQHLDRPPLQGAGGGGEAGGDRQEHAPGDGDAQGEDG